MSGKRYENSGTLGRNKRREKDTHPTHSGQATIDGKEYWVSGWINENKETGERFFRLTFQPKMAREHRGAPDNPPARRPEQRWSNDPPPRRQPENSQDEFHDDIPF